MQRTEILILRPFATKWKPSKSALLRNLPAPNSEDLGCISGRQERFVILCHRRLLALFGAYRNLVAPISLRPIVYSLKALLLDAYG